MDDKQFEKRMELLKRSYEKVPSKFQQEEVLRQIKDIQLQAVKEEPKKTISKKQRIITWAVTLASVFIIGLLSAPYVMDRDHKQGITEEVKEMKQLIEKLKVEYPKERENKRKKLAMSEEEFSQIDFVKDADDYYDLYTNNKRNGFLDTLSTTEFQIRSNELMEKLLLPSDLSDQVRQSKIALSEGDTEKFIMKYSDKTRSLIDAYDDSLKPYIQYLDQLKVNGKLETTYVLQQQNKLPQDFQEKLNAASEQNLFLYTKADDLGIGYRFIVTSQLESITPKLANHYFGFFELVDNTLTSDMSNLSKEEWARKLPVLKETVNKVDDSSFTFPAINFYKQISYYLLKGSMTDPVFNEQGTVKDEYRNVWQSIIEKKEHNGLVGITTTINNQFKNSNWTKSTEWEGLTEERISEMIIWDDNTMSELVNVNSDFEQQVHGLYKLFAGTHDQTLLKDVDPITIVGLFYYAVYLDDRETQYALYAKREGEFQISKEEILKAGKSNFKGLQEEFISMRFQQAVHQNGAEGIVKIKQKPNERNEGYELGFRVVLTENGWRPTFLPIQ